MQRKVFQFAESQGTFVTPSLIQAHAYAGGSFTKRNGEFVFPGDEHVYSKRVPLHYVAWISGDEGMYAGETPSECDIEQVI